MRDDRKPTKGPGPGAADVVTGPVGSARLRDPATFGDIGSDVFELPGAEPPPDVPAGDPSPRSEGQSQQPSDRPADDEGR